MLKILDESALDDVCSVILSHPDVENVVVSENTISSVDSDDINSVITWLTEEHGLYLLRVDNGYVPASIVEGIDTGPGPIAPSIVDITNSLHAAGQGAQQVVANNSNKNNEEEDEEDDKGEGVSGRYVYDYDTLDEGVFDSIAKAAESGIKAIGNAAIGNPVENEEEKQEREQEDEQEREQEDEQEENENEDELTILTKVLKMDNEKLKKVMERPEFKKYVQHNKDNDIGRILSGFTESIDVDPALIESIILDL